MMNLEELGARLRDRRMEQGLSIEDIAGRLKVPPRVLRAIEEGNRAELPHAVYVRSFVKSSGLMLGVPAEELAEMLAALSEGCAVPKPIQSKGIMESQDSNERWNLVMMLVKVLVLVLIVAGGYFAYTRIFREETTPAVRFENTVPQQNQTAEGAGTTVSAGSDNPWGEPAAPMTSGEAAVTQVTQAEVQSAEKTEAEAVKAEADSLDEVLAAENNTEGEKAREEKKPEEKKDAFWQMTSPSGHRHTLVVQARDDCWIELNADKGGVIRQRVLPKGKNMELEFQNKASLRLGNPAAVDVIFNGKKQKINLRKGGVVTMNFPG